MSDTDLDVGGDTVGYGKPPKSARWKPGTSGNPKGRPKAAKSLQECFLKVAMEKVKVNTGGKSCEANILEAVLRLAISKAAGDPFLTEKMARWSTLEAPPSKPRPGRIVKEGSRAVVRDIITTDDIARIEHMSRIMGPCPVVWDHDPEPCVTS